MVSKSGDNGSDPTSRHSKDQNVSNSNVSFKIIVTCNCKF